jgi:hypothetical protein
LLNCASEIENSGNVSTLDLRDINLANIARLGILLSVNCAVIPHDLVVRNYAVTRKAPPLVRCSGVWAVLSWPKAARSGAVANLPNPQQLTKQRLQGQNTTVGVRYAYSPANGACLCYRSYRCYRFRHCCGAHQRGSSGMSGAFLGPDGSN